MSDGITFEQARELAQSPRDAIAYALVLLERLCEAVEKVGLPDKEDNTT